MFYKIERFFDTLYQEIEPKYWKGLIERCSLIQKLCILRFTTVPKEITQLPHLVLRLYDVQKVDFKLIRKLSNLKSLHLSEINVEDSDLQEFGKVGKCVQV